MSKNRDITTVFQCRYVILWTTMLRKVPDVILQKITQDVSCLAPSRLSKAKCLAFAEKQPLIMPRPSSSTVTLLISKQAL